MALVLLILTYSNKGLGDVQIKKVHVYVCVCRYVYVHVTYHHTWCTKVLDKQQLLLLLYLLHLTLKIWCKWPSRESEMVFSFSKIYSFFRFIALFWLRKDCISQGFPEKQKQQETGIYIVIYMYLIYMIRMFVCVYVYMLCAESCPTLQTPGLQPASLFYPWNFPGNNTGVVCMYM